jgi:hypothetical protein
MTLRDVWPLQEERNRLQNMAYETIRFPPAPWWAIGQTGPDPTLRTRRRRLGQRSLRAYLRRAMPMRSRMWKNRWHRATVRIIVGPSYMSRRQEAINQMAELLEGYL